MAGFGPAVGNFPADGRRMRETQGKDAKSNFRIPREDREERKEKG